MARDHILGTEREDTASVDVAAHGEIRSVAGGIPTVKRGESPQVRDLTPAPPLTAILEVVRSFWGFDTLRPLQEEAIRATLDGRDSVVVMPTGGGKSLCYQVPPAVEESTAIVVSPLISLMKDQVDGLRACGYPAAAIHSGRQHGDNDETLRQFRAGRLRLLFVSPERLLTTSFLNLIKQCDIRSFAIDEAHCISHWGHDFRPEYRKLALLKERFPEAAIHAYTATATERVRGDIASQLGLSNPLMLVGRFDRANLTYRIVPRLDVYDQVIGVLRRHKDEGVIIYCLSRNDAEAMAGELSAAGIHARSYHAGLSPEQRRRTQDAFADESLNVVAATVAFGMGIDRSNVRCIIHASMPKSVEHYQQETGRAGRDGLEAECILLYSAADAMRWQSLIAKNAMVGDEDDRIVTGQRALLEQMRRYCTVPRCRHRILTEHFGQGYDKDNCEACDVCLEETEGAEEATELAQKIISCVARIERAGGVRFGVGHVVDVLLGANTEAIRRRGHDRISTYGILKGTPKKSLTNWVYQLVDQGLLDRTGDSLPVLVLNDTSWDVLRGDRPVQLIRTVKKGVKQTRGATESWEGVDRGLFEHLRTVRYELAEADGVPAFVIFSDRTLRDMARRRPTDESSFKTVHGIGDAKLSRFGSRFTGEIESYCADHGLAVNVDVGEEHGGQAGGNLSDSRSNQRRHRGTSSSQTKRLGLHLFGQGESIEGVMEATGRVRSTVIGYLCEYIVSVKPKRIARWLDDETYNLVARAAGKLGNERLKPIYEHLEEKIPYDDIRVVLAHLEIRGD